MKKIALFLAVILTAACLAGCMKTETDLEIKPVSGQTEAIILYGYIRVMSHTVDMTEVNRLMEIYNGLELTPTREEMDVGTVLNVMFFDGPAARTKKTMSINIDINGVVWVEGKSGCFTVPDGEKIYKEIYEIFYRYQEGVEEDLPELPF